jgi:hypothetical protein
MQTGLTDHVWSLEELCALLPQQNPNAKADKELVLKALARANYGDLWQNQTMWRFRT